MKSHSSHQVLGGIGATTRNSYTRSKPSLNPKQLAERSSLSRTNLDEIVPNNTLTGPLSCTNSTQQLDKNFNSSIRKIGGSFAKPSIAPSTRHLLHELRQTKKKLSSRPGSRQESSLTNLVHSHNSSKPSNTQPGVANGPFSNFGKAASISLNNHIQMKSMSHIEQVSAKSTMLL